MILLLWVLKSESFLILQQNFTSLSICSGLGAEFEILITGLENLGIRQNKEFTIECVSNEAEMKERVLNGSAVAFGGIRPTSDLTDEGFYFTHPTFYSGLNVLSKKVDGKDPMKLFQVFSFTVWMIFLMFPAGLSLATWIYAVIFDKKYLSVEEFLEFFWEAYSSLMFSSSLTPIRPGSYLEMSLEVFMKLFFIILTAGYASYTYQNLVTFIEKFGDLAGELILIEPQYEDLCGQFTIYYYSFTKDFYQDFDEALNLLSNGEYWGIIADHTFLVEKMNQNSDFTINIYPFFRFNYVGIYGSNFDSATVTLINQALASIENTQIPITIQEKYNLIHDFSSSSQAKVSLEDTPWLFYSLIITICTGLILKILPAPWSYFKQRKMLVEKPDLTNRTQIAERYGKEIEDEKTDASWATDLGEDYVRLLRLCTLSVIEYEDKSLMAIDELIMCLKESNKEKLELIKQIENSMR